MDMASGHRGQDHKMPLAGGDDGDDLAGSNHVATTTARKPMKSW